MQLKPRKTEHFINYKWIIWSSKPTFSVYKWILISCSNKIWVQKTNYCLHIFPRINVDCAGRLNTSVTTASCRLNVSWVAEVSCVHFCCLTVGALKHSLEERHGRILRIVRFKQRDFCFKCIEGGKTEVTTSFCQWKRNDGTFRVVSLYIQRMF